MINKLCHSKIDLNTYGTSLTVTGAGGFGKTSIVTALCHHPVIKEQFTDGVVFIELGPQATDPSMKLKGLYNLLTDKHCDVNIVEQQINQLTSLYCRNLLVIIDDVWHVEDAEPIVKAFSNCKIVLTTRMNNVEQYIPTKHVVSVGPMEQSEAISLLTHEVIDISQLSQGDLNLLDELAQDVHLWPLLLSLIRGQLSHNLKQHKLCCHKAIQFVQVNLHDKGLTALDKNNIDRSRKYAVKICIDMTLELLSPSLSDNIKSLILFTGIGTSLQMAVVHNLWNITEHEARDTIDALWSYGLIQFMYITVPPFNSTQCFVEVHAVISQYIFDCMESNEVMDLTVLGSESDSFISVSVGLCKQFQKNSGIYDTSSLCATDYLKYMLNEIEYVHLTFYLNRIGTVTITDPHGTIRNLYRIQGVVRTSPNITTFFPTLNDEINSLIIDCHKILKDAHKLNRVLNQSIQRCLTQKKYKKLVQTIETYCNKHPMTMIVRQIINMLKKIIPYCDKFFLDFMIDRYESLQLLMPDYNLLTQVWLPLIKLYVKQIQLIITSLQSGSYDIEKTQGYFLSRQHHEEQELIWANFYIKIKEVVPDFVSNKGYTL